MIYLDNAATTLRKPPCVAEAVVNAWMNSESHRANILNGTYTQIGVGEVGGYWTQWFIS